MPDSPTLRPSSGLPVRLTLGMSRALRDKLTQMCRRAMLDEAGVVRKALALYDVALDAHMAGKHVCIVGGEDRIETVIRGLTTDD